MTYYEAKVTFKNEVQREKNTNEGSYLTQSLSYADCETHIMQELANRSREGDTMEINIKKSKYTELLLNPNLDEYSFFKVKVTATFFDGEKEKRTSLLYLVQAPTIEAAIKTTEKGMTINASNPEVVAVSKTPIIDYYNFLIADVAPSASEAVSAEE